MATISVYNSEDGKNYTINANIVRGALRDGDGFDDVYLLITTTLKDPSGGSIGPDVVRTLDDVPPTYSTAADFTELIEDYVDYYLTLATFAMSSSSSDSSSSLSSTSGGSSISITSAGVGTSQSGSSVSSGSESSMS